MRLLVATLAVSFAVASAPALARPITQERIHDRVSAQELAAAEPAAKKRAPSKKKKRGAKPKPDPRRAGARVNPVNVGLAAAGGAAIGSVVGLGTVATTLIIGAGVIAVPSLPVVIAAAVIGIALAVATPFLAALGGGAAVLLMDRRSKPEEWSGLIQCAASGYCMGLNMIGGTLLGGLCGNAPNVPGGGQAPGIPGPDKPAEWTAGAAIAGLVGGGLVGGLIGWAVAPDPNDPLLAITIGGATGGVLGSASAAGIGAALATSIRR